MWLEWLCLLAVAVPSVLIIVWTLVTGISPMPSSPVQRDAMLTEIPADTEGPIVELGAGWGTLAFAAARRFPRAQVIAYELSPIPWLFLVLRARASGLRNVTVRRADFLTAPLSDAQVLVSYLFRGAMKSIGEKLQREGKPGALLVTHTFAIWGWQPTSVKHLPDFHRTPVYVYRLPPALSAPS